MQVIVNPGTGPLADATELNAATNIVTFLLDIGLDDVWASRDPDADWGEGRFAFKLIDHRGHECEIQMPGWPLDAVRYHGHGQNIWSFPRLYIDGSSFVWKLAVDLARLRFSGDDC